jgi:predicted dehydrogenase
MVDAFSRAGLPLFVAYYRRRLPCFVRVKELVDSGALGRVTRASYRLAESHHLKGPMWRVDARVAGAGHFLDVGSHALDLLDYFLGPLELATSRASNVASDYPVEDTVSLGFRAAGGVEGEMRCDFASATREDRMCIGGDRARVSFPVFRSEPLSLEGAGGVTEIDLPYPPHVGQPLIQSVVDDLLGRGECPSTGESARRTSRLMDRVLDAYYGGRGDAFWEREDSWPGRRRTTAKKEK